MECAIAATDVRADTPGLCADSFSSLSNANRPGTTAVTLVDSDDTLQAGRATTAVCGFVLIVFEGFEKGIAGWEGSALSDFAKSDSTFSAVVTAS